MLTEEQVWALIREPESDRVEFTESVEMDKMGEAVCAFSNDLPNHRKPGYILIGVRDEKNRKSGPLAGKVFGDTELQTIGGIRSDGNVAPIPTLTVSPVYHMDGGDVIVIEVQPSYYPPMRYKGVTWIRVGPRKARATVQDENILSEKRVSNAATFDSQPCLSAKLDDLNLRLFEFEFLPKAIDKEVLAANGRTVTEQLAGLHMYDPVHQCPSNAGILLFGYNPRYFFPGGYIQYVRFDGTLMTDGIAAEKEFSGPLASTLERLDYFIRDIIVQQRPVRIPDTFRERMVYNYPHWALRELLMNAVMHRDYRSNTAIYIYHFSDRVVIKNHGGLYGKANIDFPANNDYRNPIIASAMKPLGYVNRFNIGIRTVQQKLIENGNPPAIFEPYGQVAFEVTVPVHPLWLENPLNRQSPLPLPPS